MTNLKMPTGLPSAEEILGGVTQAGVAPPPSFKPHEDDGTVHSLVDTGTAHVAASTAENLGQNTVAAKDEFDELATAAATLKAARAEDLASHDALRQAQSRREQARSALEGAQAAFDAATKKVRR